MNLKVLSLLLSTLFLVAFNAVTSVTNYEAWQNDEREKVLDEEIQGCKP
jgi:hypothetical protein